MGLAKRIEFDYSKPSPYKAAGYSFETVGRELEPRTALLAEQIVDEAGMCATMTVSRAYLSTIEAHIEIVGGGRQHVR